MELFIVNVSDGFKAATDEDYEKKRMLRKGEVYKCRLILARNYAFHRKYFALISCAWEYLDETQQRFFKDNIECFRKSLEIACGWCEPVYNVSKGEWTEIPKSIAFDKMSQEEFDVLYNRVRDTIFRIILPKTPKDEFENNLRNF